MHYNGCCGCCEWRIGGSSKAFLRDGPATNKITLTRVLVATKFLASYHVTIIVGLNGENFLNDALIDLYSK